MMIWASRQDLQEKIANVPRNWLDRFMVARPDDIRKMADGQGGRLLFRVSAVLEAIETGELKRSYNYQPEPTMASIKPAVRSRRSA